MQASCTLEAGVKIYSLRVDSTHSEAYKLLGGINRATADDDKGKPSELWIVYLVVIIVYSQVSLSLNTCDQMMVINLMTLVATNEMASPERTNRGR